MGAACCTARDFEFDESYPTQLWLKKTSRETAEVKVVHSGSRGFVTVAKRAFSPGDVIIDELPIALLFPSKDTPWLATLRRDVEQRASGSAWQFCVAAHCLAETDLMCVPPGVLRPVEDEEAGKVMELGAIVATRKASPGAEITAKHIMDVSAKLIEEPEDVAARERRLALRVDAVAARVAKHAFHVEDKTVAPPCKADALFYRAAFVGACSAGGHNAAWDFDGARKTLTVTAVRDICPEEEVTVDPATKPWLARVVGDCACRACCVVDRAGRRVPAKAKIGAAPTAEAPYVSGSTEAPYSSGATEESTVEAAVAQTVAAVVRKEAAPTPGDAAPAVVSDKGVAGKAVGVEAAEPALGVPCKAVDEAEGQSGEGPEIVKLKSLFKAWGKEYSLALVGADAAQPVEPSLPPAVDPAVAEEAQEKHPKLEGLLKEWGQEYVHPPSPSSTAGRSASESASNASNPVVCGSEDARLERLLKRCACEGLTVSREVAEAVLREEGGSVSKAIQGVRRRNA